MIAHGATVPPEAALTDEPSAAQSPAAVTVNLEAEPPQPHVLETPLTLEPLPDYRLPRDRLGSWLGLLLTRMGLIGDLERDRRRWQLLAQTARVMAALDPTLARPLARSGWFRRRGLLRGGIRLPPLTHPYALVDAIDALMQDRDATAAERKFLELLLGQLMRQHQERVTLTLGRRFSYEFEAKTNYIKAVRLELMEKRVNDASERASVLQNIYNSFYHCRYYYVCSVLAREKRKDGKMFLLACHACYGLARFQDDGTFARQPDSHRLPRRDSMLFLMQRDPLLQQLCRADEGVRNETKALVKGLRP